MQRNLMTYLKVVYPYPEIKKKKKKDDSLDS